jgi:hypothetical protein
MGGERAVSLNRNCWRASFPPSFSPSTIARGARPSFGSMVFTGKDERIAKGRYAGRGDGRHDHQAQTEGGEPQKGKPKAAAQRPSLFPSSGASREIRLLMSQAFLSESGGSSPPSSRSANPECLFVSPARWRYLEGLNLSLVASGFALVRCSQTQHRKRLRRSGSASRSPVRE